MSMQFYKENAWWVSPFNEKEEVVEQIVPSQTVDIHDATLRDGEQTPGVVFSQDDKVRIAEKLIEAGITRIEAGMPAVSQSDYDAIKTITKTFKEANIYAFARALNVDIDMALDCGAKGVIIEIPIGYPKLKYQFEWTWETVLEKSLDCIKYAKSKGLKAVYFPYDTTRAREEDLEAVIKGLMQEAPPDAIGLVDTVGCAMPQTIAYMVRYLKRLTNGLPVEVHTHNDFGMAVASELAGVSAGAEVVHSCVNGLGERTGNAALEELVFGLNILMGLDTPFDIKKMQELCELVSKISGVPIAPNKPITGPRNYTRESGIGINMVLEQPLAMFSTDPRYFNKQGDIVLGKKSGKASVVYYLDKLGLQASDDAVKEILDMVKSKGSEKKALLTDEEFIEIVSLCNK